MKKYKMNLPTNYLKKIAEYDRTKTKIDAWTYNSGNVINSMVDDIKSGKGIEKPVEVLITKDGALMVQGCHRLVAALITGLGSLAALVIFYKRLPKKYKSAKSKLKKV